MTPRIIAIVLANTFTADDLLRRIALLRLYLEAHLFGDAEGKKETLEGILLKEKVDAATSGALREWEASFAKNAITLESLRIALTSVEEDIRGLPSLRLYVPTLLGSSEVQRVGMWVRREIDPNLMLELHVDARAAGGCAFVWHDTFHDYSLRHFMRTHRSELIASFDHYGSMGTAGSGA